jgi:hypothetical protein
MGLITGLALGAAALGAGASAISGNKASKRAAQTSQDNNAANVALARESRDMSLQRLDPYNFRGNVAGNQINALLGLGGSQNMGGQVAPNALSQFQGQYSGNAGAPYGIGEGFTSIGMQNPMLQGGATSAPAGVLGTPQTAQQAANEGFDIFRNSTGYQFTRGEGLDAVTSAYSGIGAMQSGAAMRGIVDYGQNQALNNAFTPYMNALGAQQAVGAGAASAGAGVTQNFAGTVIDSNNYNTQNQMAAQLSRQNVFGNMLGTLGGSALGYLNGRG